MQKTQLKILFDFGTLLGAVRHKGFIPWDDDVDVGMLREDYDKLCELLYDMPNERYHLFAPETNNIYLYSFGKLIDTKTYLVEKEPYGVDLGVYIDIFRYDNETSNKFIRKFRHIKHFVLDVLLTQARLYDIVDNNRFTKKIENFLIKIIGGKRKIVESWMKLSTRYKNKKTELVSPKWFFSEKMIMPRELFENVSLVSFEGFDFPAPSDTDFYLSHAYGDYMTPPPEDKRTPKHGFQVYWKD